MICSIDFKKAKEMIDSTEPPIILDVREEIEYITGHIGSSVLLPIDTINRESAAKVIPSLDTPVMVYCKSGNRSTKSAYKLAELGYTKVYNLGGLVGWPYDLEY